MKHYSRDLRKSCVAATCGRLFAAAIFFAALGATHTARAQGNCDSAYDMGRSLAEQKIFPPHQIAQGFYNMAVASGCGQAFLDGQAAGSGSASVPTPPVLNPPPPSYPPYAPPPPPNPCFVPQRPPVETAYCEFVYYSRYFGPNDPQTKESLRRYQELRGGLGTR